MQPEAYQIARSMGPAVDEAGPSTAVAQQTAGPLPAEPSNGHATQPHGDGRGGGSAASMPAASPRRAGGQQGVTPGKKRKGKQRRGPEAESGGEARSVPPGGESLDPSQQQPEGASVDSAATPRSAPAKREATEAAGGSRPSSAGSASDAPAMTEPAAQASSTAVTPARAPAPSRRRSSGRQPGEGSRASMQASTQPGSRGSSRSETPSKPPPPRPAAASPAASSDPSPEPEEVRRSGSSNSSSRRRSSRGSLATTEQPAEAAGSRPTPEQAAGSSDLPVVAGDGALSADSSDKPTAKDRQRSSAAARARQAVKLACPPGLALRVGEVGLEVTDATELCSRAQLSPAASCGTEPGVARSCGAAAADPPSPSRPLSWPVPPGPSEYGVQYDFGQVSPLELSIDLPDLPGESGGRC